MGRARTGRGSRLRWCVRRVGPMVLETAAAWAADLAVVAQAQDRLIFWSPRTIR